MKKNVQGVKHGASDGYLCPSRNDKWHYRYERKFNIGAQIVGHVRSSESSIMIGFHPSVCYVDTDCSVCLDHGKLDNKHFYRCVKGLLLRP